MDNFNTNNHKFQNTQYPPGYAGYGTDNAQYGYHNYYQQYQYPPSDYNAAAYPNNQYSAYYQQYNQNYRSHGNPGYYSHVQEASTQWQYPQGSSQHI